VVEGVVDSVVVVAVESATAGKPLLLIKTPNGFSGPGLPNLLLRGIRQRGPEFLQKTG
jgi:hypothetical protein